MSYNAGLYSRILENVVSYQLLVGMILLSTMTQEMTFIVEMRFMKLL
jgi:hypothetical protein